MASDKAEVMSVGEQFIPKGSMAETAALVRFGDGTVGIVEMFTTDHGRSVDFRGLPDHLADGDAMCIVIDREPGVSNGTLAEEETSRARRSQILFEYAIGARQKLWKGAHVEYFSEKYDPTSRHYQPYPR